MPGERVEQRGIVERPLELLGDPPGHQLELAQRRAVSGRPGEEQRDRTERVDERLRRGHRPLLAGLEREHGVGRDGDGRIGPVRDRDRRPPLDGAPPRSRRGRRATRPTGRSRSRARRRGAAAARRACRATAWRRRPGRGSPGRGGTGRNGPRSTSCRARRSAGSGRHAGGAARRAPWPWRPAREAGARVQRAARAARARAVCLSLRASISVGENVGDSLVAHAAAAVGHDVATGAGRSPESDARLDGDGRGELVREVAHPRMAVRVAEDDDERPAAPRIPRPARASAVDSSRTSSLGRPLGITDPSECSASPAAMFTRGRSSTTSGGDSSATTPSSSSARRAAMRPASRSRAPGTATPEPTSATRPAASRSRPSSSSPSETARTSAARIGVDSLLAEVVADQERVDAGGDRQHGASLDPVGLADGLHLERVGDHQPVVAELAAEQSREDRRAQRGGQRRRAPGRARARS